VLVGVTLWRFKSSSRHHFKRPRKGLFCARVKATQSPAAYARTRDLERAFDRYVPTDL
jgi:hypothetical protein